jgi:U3 small nucleolar RNA-associated protein 13
MFGYSEQNLANSLRSKDYRKALRIAFHLEKPARILQILEQIITEDDAQLRPLVADFTYDQVEKSLLYIRDWNTNAKNSLIAQRALYEILSQFSAESLCKIPRIKEVRWLLIGSVALICLPAHMLSFFTPQILQALIPYSQRHFQRVDKLVQKSFIIDYTLQSMQILDDMVLDEFVSPPERARSRVVYY